MSDSPPSALLQSLEEATTSYPLERKLLVCPSMGVGRELLRALVVRGRSWVGWQVTTPRRLAIDMTGQDLSAAGLSLIDRFEERALVDGALDEQLARPGFEPLRELGEAVGFRDAVGNAISALRLAAVDPDRLNAAPASNPLVRDLLTGTLAGYVEALGEGARTDTAGVLHRAARAVRASEWSAPGRVFLLPGLQRRGRGGELIGALEERGARPLRCDPVSGVTVPPAVWTPVEEPAPLSPVMDPRPGAPGTDPATPLRLDLFSATGPAEELREVLRRAMDAGLRWDQVEIVATDPVVYGSALHALASPLGISVSYGVGLPVERTRAGRAVAAYFRWVAGGFPADVIRHLLESGDIVPPGDAPVDTVALARRLRRLRVGWGRHRYLPAIRRRLETLAGEPRPRRDESAEEAAQRVARERAQLETLRAMLEPVLDATPDLDSGDARVSPAGVARGLGRFLELVPDGEGPSATARRRLVAATDRVAATLIRETSPAAAMGILREHLEIRVPAPDREGSAPWVSSGGHLHITDVDHGGYTGREATFVVGLDADRFPGRGLQDPLLLDEQRRALDPEALPSSADLLAGARFRMAALLARLRGRVTLSYSAWDPAEARSVAPASLLLQAYRLREGRPGATFADLHDAMGEAASAVPRDGARLDAADVWLGALDGGGIFLNGRDVVRAAYPHLDAGLRARAALAYERPTEHHGLVTPRPGLDPRQSGAILSASGVQDLGACGLRYLYRSVLGIRPPDDPAPDPDRWLEPMYRGRLLHSVFERVLRQARAAGLQLDDPEVATLAETVLEEEAERIRRQVPPPGEAVASRELVALEEDVRSFVHMLRERGADWVELELKFGLAGRRPAVIRTPAGEVRFRGAIDRVDADGAGLRVVDYKTGRTGAFRADTGAFDGGRRLQNVIYAAVAESLLDRRVERMEYHFPTRRGENSVRGYARPELRRGLALMDRLLDLVAAGRFLPTENTRDCRFCDYGPICRVREEGYTQIAPMAEWAARVAPNAEEYQGLLEVRRFEEWVQPELGADGEA
ncbi:MAG TPA: PD-(D/E)XK nuclease family protein [Longimicrobiales bacterium]|nr:PD-(D/E)XK nuclease family protein [Longimicrobiales bacterium]